MKDLSIVIPCYNSENTLADTVNSLLREFENNLDLEIIIVNDGSSDNTETVANSLITNHSCISIKNKPNGGLSDARNFGFSYVAGRYVWFFDSDDLLFDGVGSILSPLIKSETEDFIRFDSVTEDHSNSKMIQRYNNVACYTTLFHGNYLDYLKKNKMGFAAWGMISRTDFLRSHNIKFDTHLSPGEDVVWNMEIAKAVSEETYLYMDLKVVRYIVRPESITNTTDPSRNLRHLKALLYYNGVLNDFLVRDKDARLRCSLDNYIPNAKHLIVTRFFSCRFGRNEIAKYAEKVYSITFGYKLDQAVKLFNRFHSNPTMLSIIQTLYSRLFLPYFKPLISRN